MALSSPLLDPAVRAAVRRAASAHRGTPWTGTGFTDLTDRAAHPCGIFQGTPFPVFAQLSTATDGSAQFTAEPAGLRLYAYLAVLAVAGGTPFGRQVLARIDQAVTSYR